MSTQTYYFSGTANWCKYKKIDEYGKFTVDVTLDDASQDLYKKSGIRVQVKENKDGDEYVKFSRKPDLEVKGETIDIGPPKIYRVKGDELVEFTDNVGNGSKVTVKVTAYDTKAGKGHRWESLRIDELVEFNPGAPTAPDSGLPF